MEIKVMDPTGIPGWGMDADPRNEPTYPMKKYTGDDHKRSHWQRPSLQPATAEILKSTERPHLSAVFGSSLPPRGLTGAIRRGAFRFSESMNRRWLLLILADRMAAVGGRMGDFFTLRWFRAYRERGWRMLAKHRPGRLFVKVLFRLILLAALVTGILCFFTSNSRIFVD